VKKDPGGEAGVKEDLEMNEVLITQFNDEGQR
jgi:hypothetical protein